MVPSDRFQPVILFLLPGILYAVILAQLFLPQAMGQRTLFAGDIHQHYLPWEHFVSEELAADRLPVWDPGFYMGHPVLAEGQAAVFYPITRGWYALLGPTLPGNLHAFNLDVLTHYLIAGWGIFYLALVLGLPWRSAFLAGLFGCFAGSFLVLPVNMPLLRVAAWTGWVLGWGTQYLRSGEVRYWAAVTAGWSLCLLAGGPQMTALLWFAAFIYGLLATAEIKTNPRPGLSIGLLLLTPIVAAGIAAVQLIPTWLLYRESAIKGMAGAESLQFSATWLQLTSLLLPPTWAMRLPGEHPLPSYYPLGLWCGTLATLGALLAYCVAEAPMRLKVLLALLVLFALGSHTPVYPAILEALPVLGLFRAPDRFLVLACVPLCVLAGFGLEALLASEEAEAVVRRRVWGALALILLLTLIGGYTSIGTVVTNLDSTGMGASGRWWAWTLAAGPDLLSHLILGGALAAATFPSLVRRMNPNVTVIALTLLACLQVRLMVPYVAPLQTLPISDLTALPPVAGAIQEQIRVDPSRFWGRVLVVDPVVQARGLFPELRVGSKEGVMQTDLLSWYHGAGGLEAQRSLLGQLNANSGNLWGLDYATGIASLYTARADEYLYYMESAQLKPLLTDPRAHRQLSMLDLAGVRYLVLPERPSEEIMQSVDVEGQLLGINSSARPLVWLMQPSRLLPENPDSLQALAEMRVDPGQALMLDSVREPQFDLPQAAVTPTVRWTWRDPAHITAEVEAFGPSYLVVSEQWMPGWQARVNKRAVRVHRAYGMLMAIPVEEGRNKLELEYTAPGYAPGLQISIATLGLLLAAGVWFGPLGWRLRRKAGGLAVVEEEE